MIRINRNPGPRMLRQFGGIWLIFASLLAGIHWWGGGRAETALGLWAATGLVALAGFIYLPIMRLLYLGLSYLTWPIGWVISHLLLGAIYFLVLTPTGLLLRITGRDPMNRRLDRSAPSYWVEHPPGDTPERYFRQF